MDELYGRTAIETELNKTIADLWMSYEIGGIRADDAKVNLHFFSVNHGSIYIPFITKNNKYITISKYKNINV